MTVLVTKNTANNICMVSKNHTIFYKHSMELPSINCCLNIKIKRNTDIILF